jgi:hypothetical protein
MVDEGLEELRVLVTGGAAAHLRRIVDQQGATTDPIFHARHAPATPESHWAAPSPPRMFRLGLACRARPAPAARRHFDERRAPGTGHGRGAPPEKKETPAISAATSMIMSS